MAEKFSLQDALQFLLRPICRFCLRKNLFIHDLIEASKKAFLDVAVEELRKTTTKINASRINVATGLDRRDVQRLFKGEINQQAGESASVLARVANRWQIDQSFMTSKGKPRALSYEGPESEFFELVGSISKSINPATVLFELERVEAIQFVRDKVQLVRYNPSIGAEPDKVFGFLSDEIQLAIDAAVENSEGDARQANLFMRTKYDNIYVKDLHKARIWMMQQGKLFHKRARAYFKKIDKDLAPASKQAKDLKAGGMIALSTVSYTKPSDDRE